MSDKAPEGKLEVLSRSTETMLQTKRATRTFANQESDKKNILQDAIVYLFI